MPETPMTKNGTERCMILIIWSISGIHSLLALTKGMKEHSQYFGQDVSPDVRQNIRSPSRKKTLKGILLHLDNALAHDRPLSPEKIECAKAQRVPHRHYGPGWAPNGFFIFGDLKEKLRRTSLTASDDRIFATGQIFCEIPEIVLKNLLANLITRLSWVMKKGGEYYIK
jgi:hypothetical protein